MLAVILFQIIYFFSTEVAFSKPVVQQLEIIVQQPEIMISVGHEGFWRKMCY